MDRKKTIMIAVLINAGLLAVLFIAAMTMQEEPALRAEVVRSLGEKVERSKPVFVEPVEVLAPLPLAAMVSSPEAPIAPTPAKGEEPVVHSLPPLAVERLVPTPAAPVSNSFPIAAPQTFDIVVERGDSLDKLSKKYHTSVDELLKLNQLSSSFLKVGQKLKIPVVQPGALVQKSKPAAPASDQAEYYTMKVGDNPWSIAMKHHLKVDELLKMNGLNEEKARKLKPGDRLRIK